jgi:hypothetical protein
MRHKLLATLFLKLSPAFLSQRTPWNLRYKTMSNYVVRMARWRFLVLIAEEVGKQKRKGRS